jgi:hypothetical protein
MAPDGLDEMSHSARNTHPSPIVVSRPMTARGRVMVRGTTPRRSKTSAKRVLTDAMAMQPRSPQRTRPPVARWQFPNDIYGQENHSRAPDAIWSYYPRHYGLCTGLKKLPPA